MFGELELSCLDDDRDFEVKFLKISDKTDLCFHAHWENIASAKISEIVCEL